MRMLRLRMMHRWPRWCTLNDHWHGWWRTFDRVSTKKRFRFRFRYLRYHRETIREDTAALGSFAFVQRGNESGFPGAYVLARLAAAHPPRWSTRMRWWVQVLEVQLLVSVAANSDEILPLASPAPAAVLASAGASIGCEKWALRS